MGFTSLRVRWVEIKMTPLGTPKRKWGLQVHMLYVASFESKIIEPERARLQKVLMLLITIIKV
jgi:hypothetical protein